MKRPSLHQAILAVAIAGLLGMTPSAGAATHSFSGSCDISGPIAPDPGITAVPRPGARFSFHGTGHCLGRLDGRPKRTMKVRLDFVDVKTLFDTCELGPDFGLRGPLTMRRRPGRWVRFPITLDLARLAIAGPLALRAAGGGLAVGLAQFTPADPRQALFQCGGAGGGLTDARLTASMHTLSPLVG